jgi:hypothetical protein
MGSLKKGAPKWDPYVDRGLFTLVVIPGTYFFWFPRRLQFHFSYIIILVFSEFKLAVEEQH